MSTDIKTDKNAWWVKFWRLMKTHIHLTVIIGAALLLELTNAVMYYSAQDIIQQTMEGLVEREMNAIYLCIRNQLIKVEVMVDNATWMVRDQLKEPDSLFRATYKIVENNPTVLGSSITCVPNYFPQKGRWFEPYAVRRADGSIETMQLGSATHDYTKSEFFVKPIAIDGGYWTEPYLDSDGAKTIVTTYCVPVRDYSGKVAAVVDADISLEWLNDVVNESKLYRSTMRLLLTGSYNMLTSERNPLYDAVIDRIKADNGKKGYFTMEDGAGKKKHVFFTPVGGNTDWLLVSILDDSEVFGKLRQVLGLLFIMALAGLLLIGFIVWRSSRNLERLRIINAEKERISSDLRIASRIQQSMLPHSSLHMDDLDISGSLVPAREVGGDLYDYFVRDEKLFFCIGDVSGKGVPTAILMASTRSLIRAFSVRENNPAHIMRSVNEAACQGNDDNMFVTLFIGVLDLPTGRLRYCNAGHDAPIVMIDGEWTMLAANPHLPIGLFDDMKYGLQETILPPNSALFLYTDGLTEAINKERKMFGIDRVKEVLRASAATEPKPLLDAISASVHQFVGNAEQSDDLTMLAIRYTPHDFQSVLNETLTLKNDVHDVPKLNSFQKSVYQQLNLEKSFAQRLRLAVEEAVVNVMEYAYPENYEGSIEVRMTSDGHRLRIMIVDAGVPFDPTAKEKTDTTLGVEDRQVGGLGILLVRELMDAINYERIDGHNILTLIKQINN